MPGTPGMFENEENEENEDEQVKTEEATVGLEPFTLDDAAEDDEACLLCLHRPTCPIIVYVNRLSSKRDGKTAEDEFSCSIFKSENDEK